MWAIGKRRRGNVSRCSITEPAEVVERVLSGKAWVLEAVVTSWDGVGWAGRYTTLCAAAGIGATAGVGLKCIRGLDKLAESWDVVDVGRR